MTPLLIQQVSESIPIVKKVSTLNKKAVVPQVATQHLTIAKPLFSFNSNFPPSTYSTTVSSRGPIPVQVFLQNDTSVHFLHHSLKYTSKDII